MPEPIELWSEGAYGEGRGDLPSEKSVAFDSAPGEGADLRMKNEVNLLPGEDGFRTSNDLMELIESMRRGGGLSPGLNTISSDVS